MKIKLEPAIVSALALFVSVCALAWQASAYRLAGPRLRLNLKLGVITHRGALVKWDALRWPKKPIDQVGLRDDDLWAEVLELTVANRGRTVVWVSDLGLDFGRTRWWRRRRTALTLRPLAIHGGRPDTDRIRLEPGEFAFMYVLIGDSIEWAIRDRDKRKLRVRPTVNFGGTRVKRGGRRGRSWRVTTVSASYPHLPVTRHVRIFRELLKAWPTSDITKVYDAWLGVTVALADSTRATIVEVLEPYFPDVLTRLRVMTRLTVLGSDVDSSEDEADAAP